MYMAKYAKTNPDLVAAELEVFSSGTRSAGRRRTRRCMDRKSFVKVDEMFDELKKEGFYEEDGEEDVKSSNDNDHKAGTSDGPPGVIDLDDDDEFD